jgi:Tfp pilus assembly protein PilV
MTAESASFSVSGRLPAASASITRAAAGHKSSRKTGLRGGNRGFTLMEVMLASAFLVMTAAGFFSLLFKAYELSALARYRDDARSVLQTYADQFDQLIVTQPTTGNYVFGKSGTGLAYWQSTNSDLELSSISASATTTTTSVPASMPTVYIGGNGPGIQNENSLPATISYTITPITNVGGPLTFIGGQALFQATFTISYQVYGRTYYQSLTVVRLTS